MRIAIPVKLFTLIDESIDIADTNPTTKFPKLYLIEIPGRIGLNVGLHMEFLIELLEEESLLEIPAGWLSDGIHVPAFSDNAVFDDAGVTDEGVHAIGDHCRGGVTVVDSRSHVLLSLFARSEKRKEESGKKNEECKMWNVD